MCHVYFFFFNDTATTEIYTLSLHDALPIFPPVQLHAEAAGASTQPASTSSRAASSPVVQRRTGPASPGRRSEEHTSELQSRQYLVCRLLLEKKKSLSHKLLLTYRRTPHPSY